MVKYLVQTGALIPVGRPKVWLERMVKPLALLRDRQEATKRCEALAASRRSDVLALNIADSSRLNVPQGIEDMGLFKVWLDRDDQWYYVTVHEVETDDADRTGMTLGDDCY